MRPSILGRSLSFGALIAAALICGPARADFIASETSSATRLANNSFLYSYTITVAANSTSSVSEFDINPGLGVMIDPSTIIAPSNFFTFYTSGDPFMTFTGYDSGTGYAGIAPGSTGTFSYISTSGPTNGSFQMYGTDPAGNFGVMQGSALVPAATPEPASLVMTGLGLCGVLGFGARSRRRAIARVG